MRTINMLISRLMVIAILLGALTFVSCDKEESVNEAQVLVEYLESTIDPISWMAAIKSATQVNQDNTTGSCYIIDVRSATDYAAGHIENAVNVPLSGVLDHMETTDLSAYEYAVLVCYSGQSAAWGTSLLRLAGFDNVYSMAFGMSSWNPDYSTPWNSNVSNTYWGDFVTTATEKGPEGYLPKLSTGKKDAEEILAERIDAIFAEGFSAGAKGKGDVMPNPENFYIVNYWPANHYSDPGHIPGAIQYTPKEDLKTSTYLKTLPTDKPVVVYCYSGQTSAYMAAYLRLLGYDAYTLTYGANGMIYDHMPASKWQAPAAPGFPVVQ